jgi:hypothetical protein
MPTPMLQMGIFWHAVHWFSLIRICFKPRRLLCAYINHHRTQNVAKIQSTTTQTHATLGYVGNGITVQCTQSWWCTLQRCMQGRMLQAQKSISMVITCFTAGASGLEPQVVNFTGCSLEGKGCRARQLVDPLLSTSCTVCILCC